MTLALAKILVERGLVSPSAMDDALQRQVVFGGSLDTNLLELELITEPAVTEALSAIHRMPVLSPTLAANRDPRIINLFPPLLAQKYQVAPLFVRGRTLYIVSSSRPNPLVTDEIGYMLSLKVHTFLVCEARLLGFFHQWFKLDIESRYLVLMERLGAYEVLSHDKTEAGMKILRSQESDSPPPETLAPAKISKVKELLGGLDAALREEATFREKRRSGRIPLKEAIQVCMNANERDDIIDTTLRFSRQFVPFVALFVINNDFILGWDAVGATNARELIRRIRIPTGVSSVLSMVLQTRAYYLGPIQDSIGNNEFMQVMNRQRPKNALVVPILLKKRIIGLLYGDAATMLVRGANLGELLVFVNQLSLAFEQLILKKKAEEKSIETLAVPVPPKHQPASILTKEASAQNFKPLAQPMIPIPVPPVRTDPGLRQPPGATSKKAEPTRAEEEAVVVEQIPLVLPAAELQIPAVKPAAQLAPVVEEPVHIEDISEKGSESVSIIDEENEVVVIDTETGFAPNIPSKTEPGLKKIAPAPPVQLQARPAQIAPAKPKVIVEHPLPPEPVPPAPAPIQSAGVTDEIQRIEAAVQELVSGDNTRMARACDLLVAIGPTAIPAILLQFPGKLTFDIKGAHDSIPPLKEHSELVRCLLELGADACPGMIEKLESSDARIRYYAVRLLGEIYCPRAVPYLAKRLYDRDALIRMNAIESLQLYRKTPVFERMLANLRGKLTDPNSNQQAIASALLGNFKDREALPMLATLVRSPHKMVSRAAIESLSFITKQDLGANERKWIKWWKSHKGDHRVKWLIAGLRSKNRDIRFSSAKELTQITKEYFGYYFDSNKEDREKAVRQWEQWWEEKGRTLSLED